jgi:acetyltransferase-like isoleucine patch superfamily enzyme
MWGTELHVYNFRDLPHAFIRIGKGCIIGESNIIRGPGGVEIGDQVLTAPGVQILSSNHLYGDPDRPIMEQGVSAKGIAIDDGAWIGAGALILDGVKIGRNSVVGAGAVVTRDIPPYGIAVGAPAEVVGDARTDAGRGPAKVGNASDSNMMPSLYSLLRVPRRTGHRR